MRGCIISCYILKTAEIFYGKILQQSQGNGKTTLNELPWDYFKTLNRLGL